MSRLDGSLRCGWVSLSRCWLPWAGEPRSYTQVAKERRLWRSSCGPCCEASALKRIVLSWLFVARLEAFSQQNITVSQCQVEVQVVACTMWEGSLPESFQVSLLGCLWDEVLSTQAAVGTSRVYSGPHALHEGATCSAILSDTTQHKVVRRHGSLVLSVHPPCRGGGVKEENLQLAQSRVATILLDRGIPLHASAQAAEALVSKAGARSVLVAIEPHDPASRWTAVTRLATEHDILLPLEQRTARAATGCKRLLGDAKLARHDPIKAAMISQCPYMTAWGLTSMESSSWTRLKRHLSLASLLFGSFCVVIPGHGCPDEATCSGKVNVPVRHRLTGQSHLLAACHHDLGAGLSFLSAEIDALLLLPDVPG